MTLTAPQAMVAGAGGSSTVAVAAAAECAWTASTDATWITDLTPKNGQGAGSVQFTAAANPARATREADINVNGTLARIKQDVAACAITVTPPAITISSTGGPGSFTVTTLTGCAWTVSSQTPWITITSATDNDGSGTVTFNAAANTTGVTRNGSLTIAGQTVNVTQTTVACAYSLNPPSYSIGNSGGTTSVAVSTTQACAWTAASNASWITVTSGASGTGSGNVGLSIVTNTGATRSGTVLIAGQTFTVNQSADACAYTVAPLNQSLGDSGGAATPITVTTASHCTWTAASNDAWLTVASGASGAGNGTVQVNAGANSGATRAGTLTIAGQTVTITQTAAGCSYSVSPLNFSNVSVNGGAVGPITVSTASHCAWTAVSNNIPFLQVTSGASGTGNGTVQATMSANPGGSRTGSMAVAGSTVTVNQDPCSYSVTPTTTQNIGVGGGAGTAITVTTTASCMWNASTNVPWIHITSGSNGTGTNTVQFNVDAHAGPARTGTLTIANATIMVDQAGCSYSIAPSSETVSVSAGTGTSVVVTATPALCSWTAASNVSWIVVTSGASGMGNGSVGWMFGGNTGGLPRSGQIAIADKTFNVTQPACTYTLQPAGLTFSALGGINSFDVLTNGTLCEWTPSTTDTWITFSPGMRTGSGTVTFIVGATLSSRTGKITVAGQDFTVTQTFP